MQELKEDDIVQINGGGVPLAVVAVKLVTWAVATVGGAAVGYFVHEFVSNS
jgi:lactobin A/cerein 7B family class IIb bacteriocin